MSTVKRSLKPRAAIAACFILLSAGVAAAQQQPGQQPAPAPPTPQFFSLYDFHLTAAALGSADDRFKWDTHFGGEIDVFDYVVGRASVLIDYEAVLGNQLRPFDPNQGNYTLEASSSYRVGDVEIAGVFHHVSRHLSDRPKTFAIAWNIAGVRVLRHSTIAGADLDMDADLGWVTQRSYVDYSWTGDAGVAVGRLVAPRVRAFGRAWGELYGISSTESTRSTQAGGHVEAGIKLIGTAGGIELFVAVERRVDAYPLDFQPEQWAMAGFRLVNRRN